MKFYMITCHRGHLGSCKGTEIRFAIAAENIIEACDNARKMPSVKHSRMVIYGCEITEEKYNEYRVISAYERYKQHKKKRRR